jgi:predicted molibdopterin-dependent oxidoreductase YjgC
MEIGRDDARTHGIREGDKVRITSRYGEIEVAAAIGNTVSEGLLYLPVTSSAIPVYSLFSDSINGQAKAPALKSCAVRLERTADDG